MEEMRMFFEGLRQQETQRGIFKQIDDTIEDFVRNCDEVLEKLKSYENVQI